MQKKELKIAEHPLIKQYQYSNQKSVSNIRLKNQVEDLQEEIERLHDTIINLTSQRDQNEKALYHAVMLLNIIIDKKFVKSHCKEIWIKELKSLLDKWQNPVSQIAKQIKKELQHTLELFV